MGRFYFNWDGRELWIDNLLRYALDSCVYNIKLNADGDWDIMIIITGNRMVRTGKSTIAQLIGAYFSFRLGIPYTIKDVYFDSNKMVKEALLKGKYAINHYDEARRALSTSKRMQEIQTDLIDYYNESGQLNQINLIILPDFFDLKEEIAVARSEILINVYREETNIEKEIFDGEGKQPVVKWNRGSFSFFNRNTKARLYDKYRTTHNKNYSCVPANFNSNFEEFFVLPKEEYRNAKLEALKDYEENKKVSAKEKRFKIQRDKLIGYLGAIGKKDEEIGELLDMERTQINKIRNSLVKINDENV